MTAATPKTLDINITGTAYSELEMNWSEFRKTRKPTIKQIWSWPHVYWQENLWKEIELRS